MDNLIRMAFMDQPYMRLIVTDAVVVTPKSWFQKFCWKLLRRGGACSQYWESMCVSHEIVIDTTKILSAIRQSVDLFYRQYNRRPEKVLMGSVDLSELMSDPDILKYATVPFSVSLNHSIILYDLTVQVVPHMRGVLVI